MSNADFLQARVESLEKLLRDLANTTNKNELELKLKQIRFKSANDPRFRKLLVSWNVDLIIVGTWKERISKQTFVIPKIATVNVHPSLLPERPI